MMVSARKVKARLDSTKLEELKKKNLEKQEEMGISAQEAQQFSDDLVKSAISGFEKELQKSSPAIKKLAASLSGMIQEFFIGFKEGVDAELSTFVKDIGRTVTKATNDAAISDVLKEQKTEMAISDVLKEQPSIFVPDAPKQPSAPVVPGATAQPSAPVVPGATAQPSAPVGPGATAQQKTEMAISDVIKRPTDAGGAAKTVLGKRGGVKDWLTRVGLGSIGMEGIAENIVAKRQRKEAFVQAESKLRAKEFEGKSPGEIRKILEKDFKTVEKTTKELHKTEKQISAYKELGYSDEQAQTLAGEKKQELTEKLIAADPSRLGMYKDKPQEKLEKKESASVREETALEQTKLDQDAAKQRDSQTTLLGEIRDLLKTSKQGAGATSQPGALDNGVNVDVDLGPRLPPVGITKGGRRPRPSSGPAKLPLAAKLLGGLAAVGLGGYAAYQGVKDAEEEGAVSLQQIQAAETRGEITKEEAKAQTKQIEDTTTENKAGAVGSGLGTAAGALGGAKVGAMLGSFLGPIGTVVGGLAGGTIGAVSGSSVGQNIGGLIGKGVAGAKGLFGGEPTIQDTKTAELVQDKVVSRIAPAENKGFFSGPGGLVDNAKGFFGVGAASTVPAAVTRENGVYKQLPASVTSTTPEESAKQTAAEIGKNIVIQAPAPVVIPQGGGQQVVSQPFTNNIRNNEPSISDYLRSRYA